MGVSPILSAALAAHDTGLALVGGGETVINGDKTTLGIVDYFVQPEFAGTTVRESMQGRCMVKNGEIGTLSYAQTVRIGARNVFVTGQQIDAIGAVNTFTFSSTKPANELIQ